MRMIESVLVSFAGVTHYGDLRANFNLGCSIVRHLPKSCCRELQSGMPQYMSLGNAHHGWMMFRVVSGPRQVLKEARTRALLFACDWRVLVKDDKDDDVLGDYTVKYAQPNSCAQPVKVQRISPAIRPGSSGPNQQPTAYSAQQPTRPNPDLKGSVRLTSQFGPVVPVGPVQPFGPVRPTP
ncbi:hypothetical protein CRG98_015555 [Punica granatum]|uniref:Uncharacterized protein n=1 Tax=Punica granatum TaxID=22663 RepID=A0A2I0K7C6_PUNGR|nr:hypothetical protein CRG98_015555 [Punica granatum]